MKAWNYIKNDCDQETGREYSSIGKIIGKDDGGTAMAWRSASCKMICYQVSDGETLKILSLHFAPSLQSAFCTESVFCIRSAVCSLHFVLTGLVCCFCSNEPQVRTEILELEKKKFSETFLAAMIDVWTVGWGAPEEKYDDRTIITLYLLPTILYGCLWCSSAWSQRVLKWTRYGSLRCEHFGFSIQAAFLEVRKCHWRLLFLLNHKNTLFLSTRVSELHRN